MLNTCKGGCGTLLAPPAKTCGACRADRRLPPARHMPEPVAERRARFVTLPLSPVVRPDAGEVRR